MPTWPWLRIIKLYFSWLLPVLLSVASLLAFLVSVYNITHDAPMHAIYWLLFSWMTYYQSEYEKCQ